MSYLAIYERLTQHCKSTILWFNQLKNIVKALSEFLKELY